MAVHLSLLFALALAGAPDGDLLANGGFERAERDGSIAGWRLEEGAINGAREPVSKLELDAKVRHGGRRSLHFAGDGGTRLWQIARQDVEARPGGTYRLTGWTKAEGVRREGIQFDNCYLALFLFDGNGELVVREYVHPVQPDSPWSKLELEAVAPATVRRAQIACFLSKSGDFWIDDLELSIEGGEAVPAPVVVFREGFEDAKAVPPEWGEELGATNGNGEKRSTIAIDKKHAASKAGRSLRLAGEADTIRWFLLARRVPAAPGDALRLTGLVRAEDVQKQGIQFANWHLSLVFEDDAGETLGSPRFVHPGDGTYDWKPVEVQGVAPAGTTRARIGVFLSMSGDVWIDELELTRQGGNPPAYDGWKTLETKHLEIRHSPDLERGVVTACGERLDGAYEAIRDALGVEFGERITVYLYRDDAQGEALTGRALAYAAPEDRTVHQTLRNTPGHELAHVIALRMGYAQTGLLGEGIAVWLDGASADDHHGRAAELLARGELPTVEALLADFRAQPAGYPAAGSFCGFLIERFGIGDFRRLYPMADPDRGAASLLKSRLVELDAPWRAFLTERGAKR